MKTILAIVLMLTSVSGYAEMPRTDYETVAASQTTQVLGPVGAAGDVLEQLIIVPATTSPGAVTVYNGVAAGSSFVVFTGGASSVEDLKPLPVKIGARSTSTGWKVTTGSNVSVIAVGRFQ